MTPKPKFGWGRFLFGEFLVVWQTWCFFPSWAAHVPLWLKIVMSLFLLVGIAYVIYTLAKWPSQYGEELLLWHRVADLEQRTVERHGHEALSEAD
jgi:hypothetical protein